MTQAIDRREFLKLAGVGGAVFASGLAGCASMAGATARPMAIFGFDGVPPGIR